MKKIIFITCFSVTLGFGQNWIPQQSGTTKLLWSTFFLNNQTGWASGSEGSILITTNSGNNWVKSNLNLTHKVNKIYFINSLTGWAAHEYGIINTTDGGFNWNNQYIIPTTATISGIYDVYFITKDFGWASSVEGTLLNTTNSGASWKQSLIQSDLISFQFFNYNNGYAVGWSGNLYKTSDGGKSWTTKKIRDANGYGIFDIHAYNQNLIWACDQEGIAYMTTNAGDNWKIKNTGNQLRSISFTDSLHGWMCGTIGKIWYTKDGGNNWVNRSININKDLLSIYFITPSEGWVVGSGGTILKYNPSIKPTVTGFSPASFTATGVLTLTGDRLADVTSIQFVGGKTVIPEIVTDSILKVTISSDVRSGTFTITSGFGTQESNTPLSILIPVTVPSAINFTEAQSREIIISPNPNSGEFEVLFPFPACAFLITNDLGQQLKEGTLHKGTNKISLPFHSGAYYLKIGNVVKKVMLQR